MASFHDTFNDLFEPFLGEHSPLGQAVGWTPVMDVAERDDAVVIRAELPGVKADDIELSVEGSTLTISGEKKESSEDSGENYYHVERRYGSFQRSVRLPSGVAADKIDATCHDGVLTVTLPKPEEAKPKRIKVTGD